MLQWVYVVKDCKAVENARHTAFTKDRINPAREFFRTSVEYVKPILELLKIEDITTDVENDMNKGINSTEIEALNNYKKRRPQLNFEEMGIPAGSELVMNYNDGSIFNVKLPNAKDKELANKEVKIKFIKLNY